MGLSYCDIDFRGCLLDGRRMKWNVALAELKQETATFNPWLTRYADFRIVRGPAIIEAYAGTSTELAGAYNVFRSDGRCTVAPTMAAAAVSGGPIADVDLQRLLKEFIEALVNLREPIDGACLCFHGAMAGQTEGDPEGLVLSNLREALGTIPIVVTLDLHAVLTDRMLTNADILVPYHTYPHTDHYQTGARGARLLLRLLEGSARPTTARVALPMLVRGDELLTASGRFGEAVRMCREIESSPTGLAAGVLIGNAFTDVPALQSNVLVTTHQDPLAARAAAESIGRFMWQHREIFQARLTRLDDAMDIACQAQGLVVFSDAADATASGAAGDSNVILQRLCEQAFPKRALVPIVDGPAAEAAFRAGVGAALRVPLGGTRDPTRFTPRWFDVFVHSLHDGQFIYENGTLGQAGRTAVLRCGQVYILVTQRPVYVVGRRVYEAHGLPPEQFDLVVVKSPNGFRTWYESIASHIVAVDVPGSTSANLKSLPFRHCVRPMFPLDEHVPSPFPEL
jgi:microcystin degradation protein MlrC